MKNLYDYKPDSSLSEIKSFCAKKLTEEDAASPVLTGAVIFNHIYTAFKARAIKKDIKQNIPKNIESNNEFIIKAENSLMII